MKPVGDLLINNITGEGKDVEKETVTEKKAEMKVCHKKKNGVGSWNTGKITEKEENVFEKVLPSLEERVGSIPTYEKATEEEKIMRK